MSRLSAFSGIAVCGLVCCTAVFAQQGLGADVEATALASSAYLALTGGAQVSAVLLAASYTWSSGSNQQSGTAILKARGPDQSRVELDGGATLPTEIRTIGQSGPQGGWVKADGTRGGIALHNSFAPAAWFSPVGFIAAMSGTDATISYVGRETQVSSAVDHVRMVRALGQAANANDEALIRRLSTVDVYLAADSHLPILIRFTLHAESDLKIEFPVEVSFSDYRNVNGAMIPFHIRRAVQGSSNLDLLVTSATINSGVSDTDFSVQ